MSELECDSALGLSLRALFATNLHAPGTKLASERLLRWIPKLAIDLASYRSSTQQLVINYWHGAQINVPLLAFRKLENHEGAPCGREMCVKREVPTLMSNGVKPFRHA